MAGKGSWIAPRSGRSSRLDGFPAAAPARRARRTCRRRAGRAAEDGRDYLLSRSSSTSSAESAKNVDLFNFPAVDPAIGPRHRRADRWFAAAMPRRGRAKKVLAYLASPDASAHASHSGEPFSSRPTLSRTRRVHDAQKKSAELVGRQEIAQFWTATPARLASRPSSRPQAFVATRAAGLDPNASRPDNTISSSDGRSPECHHSVTPPGGRKPRTRPSGGVRGPDRPRPCGGC